MNENLLLNMAKHLLLKVSASNDFGYKELQKIAADGDLNNLKLALKNVAEQALDPKSEKQTRAAFTDNIVNIALALYPELKAPPPLY